MLTQHTTAFRQALRMYILIGVVLVAAGVRSWGPHPQASLPEQAAWVVVEVMLWPKAIPELGRRSGTARSDLRR